MKNKEVISAVVGSAFFAIPYLGLAVSFAPSLLIGCCAFGASELICSGIKSKEKLKDNNPNLYKKINDAKKQNKEILGLIPKVDNEDTKRNLGDINKLINKIIDIVSKDEKKAKGIDNFFDYYLPVLIKIVKRYEEIEDQKLVSKESKTFLEKADKMIGDTKNAFETILSSLYQSDIIDADADMKVYELMMKADGIVKDNLIMKESGNNEK